MRKDSVESYAWFRLAKANGNEEASELISDLEKEILTAEQIGQGQARASALQRMVEQKSAK